MKITQLFNSSPLHVVDHTYYFLKSQETKSFSERRDPIDVVKNKLKETLGSTYTICIYLLSPVMPRIQFSSKKLYLDYITEKYTNNMYPCSLQVGSGVGRKKDNVINLDIFNYSGVDVVADATALPFKSRIFDSYLSIAVLEHVTDPEAFLSEAFRVLKKGGIIITGAPFIQGFHASPHDYSRWTHSGLKSIHERHGFSTVSVTPIGGPASAFTWILIDFLSITLSFGSKKLFYLWFIVFSFICIPVKILDIGLIHHPEAYRISSFFVYIGKKK